MSTQSDEKLLCPICMHNLEFVAASEDKRKFVSEEEINQIRRLADTIYGRYWDKLEVEDVADARQS